ncbi:MAG: hypothetical protein M1165_02135 [Candidatus Pacearchaeota archaeon]|nr:hypothetical protein [Candidatus Pacearchaeota archaeon]
MEQISISSPEDLNKFFDAKKKEIEGMTQNIINTEMGLVELNLSLNSLDKDHLKRAHEDTESFKEEMMRKARKLALQNNSDALTEYKKLISFI